MTLDYSIITFIVLGAVIALLLVWIVRLEIKLNNIKAGSSGKRMDEVMSHISHSLNDLHSFKNDAHNRLNQAENKLKSSVRCIETLRFNPFQGTGSGGNQSFASAFVNEEGNGVVISSLYSRDRVSVFSKPLTQFSSPYELFDEEQEVINRAKNTLTR